MNKGQAFAEFARGRYVVGREILSQLAETQGDQYAQLFAIADKGYAPAAAEALRRARY